MSFDPGLSINHTRKNRFLPGTFRPHPEQAKTIPMLLSQAWIEFKLVMRHGEQLLLTIIVPLILLVGLTMIKVGDLGDPRINRVAPAVLAVAVMSTGFTGQAIAVAFDRRYGALKRLGATALPRWCIVGGKLVAVLFVAALQVFILGLLSLFLGWQIHDARWFVALLALFLGCLVFTALGLLLGGTLPSDVVLPLANLIWLLLLSCAGLVAAGTANLHSTLPTIAKLSPSGALTDAVQTATSGGVSWGGLLTLVVWLAVACFSAVRFFRFT